MRLFRLAADRRQDKSQAVQRERFQRSIFRLPRENQTLRVMGLGVVHLPGSQFEVAQLDINLGLRGSVVETRRQRERIIQLRVRRRVLSRLGRQISGGNARLQFQIQIAKLGRRVERVRDGLALRFAVAGVIARRRERERGFGAFTRRVRRQQLESMFECALRFVKRKTRQSLLRGLSIHRGGLVGAARAVEMKRARAQIARFQRGQRVRRARVQRAAPRGCDAFVHGRADEVVRERIARFRRLEKVFGGQLFAGCRERERRLLRDLDPRAERDLYAQHRRAFERGARLVG
ncbi:MAG: hypothetical protein HDKAJFGB_03153 [Anaerolineae bacterium]|nr:hypothetical protein [Anaerolineae bacterium]